ncbi:SNF2 family N-terminal domain-containing protein [Aspergillus cavernicola]|uniref:SNF2 family N-terminal domain-containing protein n=1 Tax=Aspergillus cavernicola TaxID=176166 RepID=A0ABR4ISX9_9EURO
MMAFRCVVLIRWLASRLSAQFSFPSPAKLLQYPSPLQLKMDLQYILNGSDWSDSAPSTPRSYFETPPSSPLLWSTESPITTPGNTATRSHVVDSPIRTEQHEYGSRLTQETTLADAESRRKSFLIAAKNTILPLIGEYNVFDRLSSNADSHIPQMVLEAQPVGLRATLKPYQVEGLSWLLYLKDNGLGGILADEMGLGKTLQTLSLFQHVRECEALGDHKFLVVCPLSVSNTWLSEIRKWTTGLVTMEYHGSGEERDALRREFRQKNQPVDIVVTSYETLCNDVWFFQKTIWSYIVLDEAHRIKNSQSKRTKDVYKLRAENKLVLTGTPIQNDLTELWSIFHWLYPEVFIPSTAQYFEDAFSLKNGRFDNKFVGNVTQFLQLIMLRRTKGSPGIGLNIPSKTEVNLSVPLTDSQHSWYHRILTGVNKSILLGEAADKPHQLDSQSTLTSSFGSVIDTTANGLEINNQADVRKRSSITSNILMEQRKCSIHPYLLVDALPAEYNLGQHIVENSGKFIVLQKIIHQAVVVENKKVIIFSCFDQALNLCEDLLEMEKVHAQFDHVRLDGSTSSAWRNLSVYLFQTDPRYRVFLLSIRAGGEGLNLVSSSTVVFLDEDWNPQIMRQAEARVHRIGQTQPVTIFRLYSKGTVEEQMRRRLSKKAYLADKVMAEQGHDINHPIYLDAAEEQEISLMPTRDIVSDTLKASQLVNMDIHNIVRSCAHDEISAQEMSQEEKVAWLNRTERVKTDIFNGKKIDTSSRSFNVYDKTIIEVSRASRRIGKSRVVMIGEWEVSKDSIESASSLMSPTFCKQKTELKAKKVNETVSTQPSGQACSNILQVCFLCHRWNPQECEICTRSFHPACLDVRDELDYTPKGKTIVCPHHNCCKCGKTASEAGRLLLKCLNCPKAHCEQCLDWDRTTFVGNDTEAEGRGYFPQNAYSIRCASCNASAVKRQLEYSPPDCRKRARRG